MHVELSSLLSSDPPLPPHPSRTILKSEKIVSTPRQTFSTIQEMLCNLVPSTTNKQTQTCEAFRCFFRDETFLIAQLWLSSDCIKKLRSQLLFRRELAKNLR